MNLYDFFSTLLYNSPLPPPPPPKLTYLYACSEMAMQDTMLEEALRKTECVDWDYINDMLFGSSFGESHMEFGEDAQSSWSVVPVHDPFPLSCSSTSLEQQVPPWMEALSYSSPVSSSPLEITPITPSLPLSVYHTQCLSSTSGDSSATRPELAQSTQQAPSPVPSPDSPISSLDDWGYGSDDFSSHSPQTPASISSCSEQSFNVNGGFSATFDSLFHSSSTLNPSTLSTSSPLLFKEASVLPTSSDSEMSPPHSLDRVRTLKKTRKSAGTLSTSSLKRTIDPAKFKDKICDADLFHMSLADFKKFLRSNVPADQHAAFKRRRRKYGQMKWAQKARERRKRDRVKERAGYTQLRKNRSQQD